MPLSEIDKKSVTRVLIYRLGSLGDTIVALPSLRLVARAFPQAERRMLTNFPVNVKAPPAAAILENSGLVQDYFRYAVGTRSPVELLSLWWKLLRWRPQVMVYLGPNRGVQSALRDVKFFKLCGIRTVIGAPVTEEMQRNMVEADGLLEPEGARLARNVAELGDARLEDAASWDLGLTLGERERAASFLGEVGGRPLIAVSVGTKVQSKDWGQENWRALLGRLAGLYPGYALALNGAPGESAASEFAADGWRTVASLQADPGAVINLCGRLTPRESAAAFAHARVFVGHDSGPMHLAATVQTPCVAIFAARNIPRVWFPIGAQHRVIYHAVDCAGCGLETCIVEKKKCLTSVTVDEVLAEVRAVLDRVG
ncbi:glycosyltransferase family 9 protein [Granulicella arctica]|uniref:glycosyltransferase family 9 protein n=1 Tax=Granulicella arctica TaxID=940613 RepID=UPI0021DF823D|nr:glycosyltransferase family 9 protein [Granulicella arctica]